MKNSNLENICKIYPYVLGKADQIIKFVELGFSSQISESGTVEVFQKDFDATGNVDIVGEALAKMDIEGADINALKGMASMIREKKPYLAI